MRRFFCASCGKTIEADWCTNQRGRDMKCRDCGGPMRRDQSGGLPGMCRRGGGKGASASRSGSEAGNSPDTVISPEKNVFRFNRRRRESASGFCRNRGGGRGCGCGRGAV